MRARLVVASLVLLAAFALGAASGTPSGRPARASATPAQAIVYGYPYTSRCPGAGIADVVDHFGMYACNCTSYVAWALAANGQRVGWFIRGAMNAWNWPHVAELSLLPVDRSPAVGAVAVWPKLARPFGHVAYVTGVDPGGRFDVAEYNFPDGEHAFAFDSRTNVPNRGVIFIHVPRR